MAITGTITLKEGTIIELSDENIVKGSLKITQSMSTSGKYDIGTFNASVLNIAIYDEDALLHDFGGAEIHLQDDNGSIGYYNVLAEKTKRRGITVALTAYDRATQFDVVIPDNARTQNMPPVPFILMAASTAGVALGADFGALIQYLPNVNTLVNIASPQIQTLRDVVMWCCQFICCNAMIDKEGKLTLVKARYLQEGTAITVDKIITADERVNIQFSDTRTYIRYLSAYKDRNTKQNYNVSISTTDTQVRAGEFALPYNPITDDAEEANKALHRYIGSFLQREIKATIIGEPAVKLGDCIRFSGGRIDVRNSIVGLVTDITRAYHGNTVVACHAPVSSGGD